MQTIKNIQWGGFGWVVLASIIWGTIGVTTQTIYSTDNTTPLFINLMRTLIATPILLLMSRRMVGHNLFRAPRQDLSIMSMMGICLVLSQVMYFSGIRYAGVTITTLLTLCVPPLLVVCVSVMFKWEQLNRYIIRALICALMGCVLLIRVDSADSLYPDLGLGISYSLLSAVFYAGMLISGRLVAQQYHPLQVTAIGFSAGTLVLLGMAAVSGVTVVQTPQAWGLIIYLALIPTAFAYWIFQMGLRTVSATTASIVIMLDPLVAAALAWLMFGEVLSATGITGAGLLILSLLILSMQRGNG